MHHRGVVAVDGLLPLLIRVEERMPVRRPGHGPLLRIATGSIAETVEPALREMPFRVGLHVDCDVLIHRRAQLRRLVIVELAALRTGELQRTRLRIGELDRREAALLCGCRHCDPSCFSLGCKTFGTESVEDGAGE